MSHQHNHKIRKFKKTPARVEATHNHSPRASDLAASDSMRLAEHMTSAMIHRLHRTIGNQAVHRMLMRKGLIATQPDFTLSILQRNGKETAGTKSEEKPVQTPPKSYIDKAKAEEVLQNAYKDYVKKIEARSVELLSQADFQAKYDSIYGETEFSWDKYIKPTSGNLEGFAHEGVNYINKDKVSVDTVPHEMLHNNTNPAWDSFAGSELDEGATEYLTIKAVTAAKYTPSHSYPDQEGIVQELVKMTSEDLLMKAYFKGETEALKNEMEAKCKGSWSNFKAAMQKKEWVKAKAYLKPKEKAK